MINNLKKSHIIIIAISILILLLSISMTCYLLFSSYQSVRLFNQAKNNFLRGDDNSLLLADSQLKQIIKEDTDNEAAYIMLGKIAERKKVYSEQTYYCYMAHRLNPLSQENKANYIKSLWFCRYFDKLENFLSLQSDSSDLDNQLLLYAAGRNGNFNKYKHLTKPSNGNNSIRELAILLFQEKDLLATQKLSQLEKIKENDFLKQELLAVKADLYLANNDLKNSEKALKEAHELNSYAFAPALGRFHANYSSLKQALNILEDHLATYHDPIIALETAEIYCLLKKTSSIEKLRNQYQLDSGNSAMLLCYYFDALIAFTKDDIAALPELLMPLRKNINTPLALFMFFNVSLYNEDLSSIVETYTALTTKRGYVSLQDKADNLLANFLKSKFTKFTNQEEQLILLTKLLYNRKPKEFTAKLLLLLQKKSNSTDQIILKDALKRFGYDAGIVKLAIEYYLNNDVLECQKLISYYKSKFAKNAQDMFRYEISLAIKTKNFNQISKLLQENYSPNILPFYWEFASSTAREKDLTFILNKSKLYKPFCQALLLLKKGQKVAACKLLEKSDAQNNLALLFFAAKTLAENNFIDSALKKYALFPEKSPYALDVLLNMAELFAEKQNLEKALELSSKAYKLAPLSADSQLCYADKLYRAGQLNKITSIIKYSPASKYQKRIKVLWIAGMEANIQDNLKENHIERTRELCRQLLTIDKQNKIAINTLEKINKRRL